MTARNDVNNPTLVQATLSTTGTLNGSDGLPAVVGMLGLQALSITVQTLSGSTAVGSIAVQCTDLIKDWTGNIDPNIGWAPMNYPGTATPVTIAIASGAATVNVMVPNIACKAIRLVYTATSGTGSVVIGVTGRANSRT